MVESWRDAIINAIRRFHSAPRRGLQKLGMFSDHPANFEVIHSVRHSRLTWPVSLPGVSLAAPWQMRRGIQELIRSDKAEQRRHNSAIKTIGLCPSREEGGGQLNKNYATNWLETHGEASRGQNRTQQNKHTTNKQIAAAAKTSRRAKRIHRKSKSTGTRTLGSRWTARVGFWWIFLSLFTLEFTNLEQS